LLEDLEAGLDACGDHGRVLDRGLDRPAVRRPARNLRLEVHQYEVRAVRDDERPRYPIRRLHRRLRVPPACPRPPDGGAAGAAGPKQARTTWTGASPRPTRSDRLNA